MEVILTTLLQYLRENHIDHTYEKIAMILIDHFHELSNQSLLGLCELCSCSESTFSRFLKTLGFHNYRNFMFILNQPQLVYHTYDSKEQYDRCIQQNLSLIHQYLLTDEYQYLIEDIKEASELVFIGFPTNLNYLLDFQCKMILSGKRVSVHSSLDLEHILPFDSKALVIVISFKGNFNQMDYIDSLPNTTVLLTLNESLSYLYDFDYPVLIGNSSQSGEEVYSLLYFLDMIYHDYQAVKL